MTASIIGLIFVGIAAVGLYVLWAFIMAAGIIDTFFRFRQ